MRTTLNIDDDVLAAAKELARKRRRSAGEILSELARRGLTAAAGGAEVAEGKEFYGFRVLPRRSDAVVTNELIDRLREDGAY